LLNLALDGNDEATVPKSLHWLQLVKTGRLMATIFAGLARMIFTGEIMFRFLNIGKCFFKIYRIINREIFG